MPRITLADYGTARHDGCAGCFTLDLPDTLGLCLQALDAYPMIDAPPSPGVEPDVAPQWSDKPSKGSRGAMHVHAYAPAVAHQFKPGEPAFTPLECACMYQSHRGKGALLQAVQMPSMNVVMRFQTEGRSLRRTASCQRRPGRRRSQRACMPHHTSPRATPGLQPGVSRAASMGTCPVPGQHLSSRCARSTRPSARKARERSLLRQRQPILPQSLSRPASGTPYPSWHTGEQALAYCNQWMCCRSSLSTISIESSVAKGLKNLIQRCADLCLEQARRQPARPDMTPASMHTFQKPMLCVR